MSERHRFSSFGEDDAASRRGPGVTGQRGDEEPDPPQRADVREIDLTEDDEDERDRAEVEASERVERLREAAREERDGQATVLFPPAKGDDEGAEEEGDAGQADGPDPDAPGPFEAGAPATSQAAPVEEDQDREETSQPAGVATVDISAPADEVDEAADDEPPAGVTLAPATPLPRSEEGGEAAAAEAGGGDLEAGAAVASADATPVPRSGALLATDAEAVRRQFLDIQAGFVDEPRQAVHEAESFVDDLVQQLVRALETERANLKATLESGSTEDLRVALRGYRAFVDRLLNLR